MNNNNNNNSNSNNKNNNKKKQQQQHQQEQQNNNNKSTLCDHKAWYKRLSNKTPSIQVLCQHIRRWGIQNYGKYADVILEHSPTGHHHLLGLQS